MKPLYDINKPKKSLPGFVKVIIVLGCFVAILGLIGSIKDEINHRRKGQNTRPSTRLEEYLSDFLARHENGFQNRLLFDKMNEDFAAEIKDSVEAGTYLFSDYPMRLVEVGKGFNDSTCCVHFASYQSPFESLNVNRVKDINFDIVESIPIEEAYKLKEGSYYLVRGRPIGFLPQWLYRDYASSWPYTYSSGIKEHFVYEGYFEVNIAVMLYEIESIKYY